MLWSACWSKNYISIKKCHFDENDSLLPYIVCFCVRMAPVYLHCMFVC